MDVIVNTAEWRLRPATAGDLDRLGPLIERSFRTLGARCYSPAVVDASLGVSIRLDTRLVREGTYLTIEQDGALIACGGWSTSYSAVPGQDLPRGTAEVRAMFVAPEHTRRGLGRALLAASERALAHAGYTHAHLVATLSGRELYLSAGYREQGSARVPLPGGLFMEVIPMVKRL
jgi:GNAT superfamily N-acetyltransferase